MNSKFSKSLSLFNFFCRVQQDNRVIQVPLVTLGPMEDLVRLDHRVLQDHRVLLVANLRILSIPDVSDHLEFMGQEGIRVHQE